MHAFYRLCVAAALAALGIAAPVAAQAPVVVAEPIDCLPENDNGVFHSTVRPEVGGAEVRTYFRWDERGAYYYVVMEAAGGGRYWATPPKPTDANDRVEYYTAVVAPDGRVLSRSELVHAPVTDDCDVMLSRREAGMADNLVVGETAPEQIGETVLGFLCDGIVSRIGPDDVLRIDEICRRCIIAWGLKRNLVGAAGLVGTGILVDDTPPREASPSRPPGS